MLGRPEPNKVVLRSEGSRRSFRRLTATLRDNGDLVVEGHDMGPDVQSALGGVEYEWVWTVKARHMPALAQALGGHKDVLTELKNQFSGEKASGLATFFQTQGIRFESWHWVGD